MYGNHPTIDDRDHALIEARRVAFEARNPAKPRTGEYVRLLDGRLHRFSYVHDFEDWQRAQTSAEGSWYLGDGYASFSGSLDPGIPFERLRVTGGRMGARFWLFHHDYAMAHNGVDFKIPVRIWEEVA